MTLRHAGIPQGFALEDYDFYLPEGQIAQHPALRRGTSRLLVVHKGSQPLRLEEKIFTDILDVLPEKCLLVANNSRVVPARLTGKRASGGKVEFLLLSPLPLLVAQPLSSLPSLQSLLLPMPQVSRTSEVLQSFHASGAPRLLQVPHSSQVPQTSRIIPPSQSSQSSPSASWVCPTGRYPFMQYDPKDRHPEDRHPEDRCSEDRGAAHDWYWAEAQGLLRSSKQVKPGECLYFSDDLYIEMLERHDFGRSLVRLIWRGDLQALFDKDGVLPLPPYIKRPLTETGEVAGSEGSWGSDRERYQTVYSQETKAGSVAAPTAGLHFTPQLQERIKASGREWVEGTLYVGYGTFSPVREEDIRNHTMHAEYVELSASAAEAINRAKREARPVIPVGTTSVRILEGVYRALYADAADNSPSAGGRELREYAGWVNLFLYPGQHFYMTDGLITNFHLPGSSLLMLVSAFAGRERMLEAYAYAVEHDFKFFSYGDSMFIG